MWMISYFSLHPQQVPYLFCLALFFPFFSTQLIHLAVLCNLLHCAVFPYFPYMVLSCAFLSKNFSIPLPELIGPQHYWWLVLDPPTQAFMGTSKEGTSLCTMFTKFSTLLLLALTPKF